VAFYWRVFLVAPKITRPEYRIEETYPSLINIDFGGAWGRSRSSLALSCGIAKGETLPGGLVEVNECKAAGDLSHSKKRSTPGPKADRLKLSGNWKDLVKKYLSKKKPAEGWPK
jgi:hypothetical protein